MGWVASLLRISVPGLPEAVGPVFRDFARRPSYTRLGEMWSSRPIVIASKRV